uniref:M-phase inducer phosphatase n=2 Tax=Xenopus laevis TaxID=8355 RepID=F5HR98_XENLA|nr:Cdc25 phosphatase [Xenopus laevis]
MSCSVGAPDLANEGDPEYISWRNENSDSSLDEVLTFSPDLGLSPVTSLSGSMGLLNCEHRINPRCRLKLSPDSESPSPTEPTNQSQASMETKCFTGLLNLSTPRPDKNIIKSSDSSYGVRIRPKQSTRREQMREHEENASHPGIQKKSRMKLSDLFDSVEHINEQPRQQSEKAKVKQLAKQANDKKQGKKGSENKRPFVNGISPQFHTAEIEDDHLIGDFSKTYLLPLEKGKHQDLKYISCITLARLLRGGYQDVVQQYHIVDCRYPYEYDGGHIKGAYNLYKEEHISDTFLKNDTHPKSTTLLIFHCEFSSERAPKLCRLLRNLDRNANRYPHLHYPELYILKGGYKEFYGKFKGLCEPQGYVNMLHKSFSDQLKQYHRKNKPCHVSTVRKELFKPLYSNKCTVLKKHPAKD